MLKKLNQSGFGVVEVLLTIIALALVSGAGYYVYNSNKDKSEDTANTSQQESNNAEKPLQKGDFGEQGEYGMFQAEGYATTEKRDEAFCETDCKQNEYVFFNITRTENPSISDFLTRNSSDENLYVKDKAIGMGCFAEGKISFSNASDEAGATDSTISQEDTAKIMSSSAASPIRLEIKKAQLTDGVGGNACSSLFSSFKLISSN